MIINLIISRNLISNHNVINKTKKKKNRGKELEIKEQKLSLLSLENKNKKKYNYLLMDYASKTLRYTRNNLLSLAVDTKFFVEIHLPQ
jgi:hypothetical protein